MLVAAFAEAARFVCTPRTGILRKNDQQHLTRPLDFERMTQERPRQLATQAATADSRIDQHVPHPPRSFLRFERIQLAIRDDAAVLAEYECRRRLPHPRSHGVGSDWRGRTRRDPERIARIAGPRCNRRRVGVAKKSARQRIAIARRFDRAKIRMLTND